MQPWHTPFPIWNQSVVPCPVLTVASWPAYRLLKRQVRWSGIPISFRIFQFIVIHTVKGFGIVNKSEIDVFLELSCFFDDPADVTLLSNYQNGNLNKEHICLSNWQIWHRPIQFGQECREADILLHNDEWINWYNVSTGYFGSIFQEPYNDPELHAYNNYLDQKRKKKTHKLGLNNQNIAPTVVLEGETAQLT